MNAADRFLDLRQGEMLLANHEGEAASGLSRAQREPYVFSAGKEVEGTPILTAWIREIHKLIADAAAKRGHPVLPGVRVPSRPETALAMGLDAATWAKKEGLIDLVVATPRWATLEFDMPLERWREVLKGPKAILAGGLEILKLSELRHDSGTKEGPRLAVFGIPAESLAGARVHQIKAVSAIEHRGMFRRTAGTFDQRDIPPDAVIAAARCVLAVPGGRPMADESLVGRRLLRPRPRLVQQRREVIGGERCGQPPAQARPAAKPDA